MKEIKPDFECKVFPKGKGEVTVEIDMINIHWDNMIKAMERTMNKKTAYTIGRTESYDKSLADKAEPTKKLGKRKDYEGGWIWATAEEADHFKNNGMREVCPEWKPEDFSVYKLKLPNNWAKDTSDEPGKDGVHMLLNDAIIVEKVIFIELAYDKDVVDCFTLLEDIRKELEGKKAL